MVDIRDLVYYVRSESILLNKGMLSVIILDFVVRTFSREENRIAADEIFHNANFFDLKIF